MTSTGTYTPTVGVQFADVYLVAPGGGGGGGALQAASAAVSGGAGGGGGGWNFGTFSTAEVGASQTVTLGAAGTAGAAASTNTTAGGTAARRQRQLWLADVRLWRWRRSRRPAGRGVYGGGGGGTLGCGRCRCFGRRLDGRRRQRRLGRGGTFGPQTAAGAAATAAWRRARSAPQLELLWAWRRRLRRRHHLGQRPVERRQFWPHGGAFDRRDGRRWRWPGGDRAFARQPNVEPLLRFGRRGWRVFDYRGVCRRRRRPAWRRRGRRRVGAERRHCGRRSLGRRGLRHRHRAFLTSPYGADNCTGAGSVPSPREFIEVASLLCK